MKKRPSWLNSAEKKFKLTSDILGESLSSVSAIAIKKVAQINDDLGVSDKAIALKESTVNAYNAVDDEVDVSDKAKRVKDAIISAYKDVADKTIESIDASGLKEFAEEAKESINANVIAPVSDFIDKNNLSNGIDIALSYTEEKYGLLRKTIKPNYGPESAEELLGIAKKELLYINACILQVSTGKAESMANTFGKAIASKVAGVASVGSFLTLVSAYGTASTGTAISTLSGAAATSSTIAWVGGLLGGGMVTGAVITGGLGIAVGVGVYKVIGSVPREFDDLSDVEKQIIQSTGFLVAAINDLLANDPQDFSTADAEALLNNTFLPMLVLLKENSENICENLDGKNRLAFRQHALIDFETRLIAGFHYYLNENKSAKLYPEYVISGVIYGLLTNSVIPADDEYQLALESIRRMKADWADATESELSDALSEYSPETLKGVAANVKGIYHETLFVHEFNLSNDDRYAEMFEKTNYPGADIQIKSVETDEVLEEFQLKASNDVSYVQSHFTKYPDIEVLATSEVAEKMAAVNSSGLSNDEITARMDTVLDDLSINTLGDRATDSAEIAAVLAAGKEVINVLNGKKMDSDIPLNIISAASAASVSTALVAYLFS